MSLCWEWDVEARTDKVHESCGDEDSLVVKLAVQLGPVRIGVDFSMHSLEIAAEP